MRGPLYDPHARRQSASVTLNEDLVARASALGIDIGRTAESALANALAKAETETIRADLREAARITDEYVAMHGHPFADWAETFSPEAGADDAA